MDILMLIPFLLLCGVLLILIYRLYVIEQNFASYIDFSDTKISELEAKAAQLDAFDTQIYDLISTDLYRIVSWLQLQIDKSRLEYESHNLKYFHMDANYALVKPEAVLEQELSLAALEAEIVKKSKELGLGAPIKSKRPKGVDQ